MLYSSKTAQKMNRYSRRKYEQRVIISVLTGNIIFLTFHCYTHDENTMVTVCDEGVVHSMPYIVGLK